MYVAYYRKPGSGPMQAYPHLKSTTVEEAEQEFIEWSKRFYAPVEYWITTEHCTGIAHQKKGT